MNITQTIEKLEKPLRDLARMEKHAGEIAPSFDDDMTLDDLSAELSEKEERRRREYERLQRVQRHAREVICRQAGESIVAYDGQVRTRAERFVSLVGEGLKQKLSRAVQKAINADTDFQLSGNVLRFAPQWTAFQRAASELGIDGGQLFAFDGKGGIMLRPNFNARSLLGLIGRLSVVSDLLDELEADPQFKEFLK